MLKSKAQAMADGEITPVEAADYQDEVEEVVVVAQLSALAMRRKAGLR